MERRCETCDFFQHIKGDDGECRFDIKTVVLDSVSEEPFSYWPEVKLHEWCGKYKRAGGIR